MIQKRFAIYSWLVLGINLAVILWGAYVRASGAGAGCGSHWPLCNGEVIPTNPKAATLIELAHRLTSGVSLLLIIGLVVWAFLVYPKGNRVRFGASLCVLFIFTEALVGAGLVLFKLVAHDESVARALFMSVHLANTLLLLAALTATSWWASGGHKLTFVGQGGLNILFAAALAMALLVGISGALAALGDTLFPSSTLAEGMKQDFSETAHLLIRLRLLHPVLAVGSAIFLILTASLAYYSRVDVQVRRFALVLVTLSITQVGAGLLNVVLLAPIWMQLTHLLLADLVWIALILLTTSTLARNDEEEVSAYPTFVFRPVMGAQESR